MNGCCRSSLFCNVVLFLIVAVWSHWETLTPSNIVSTLPTGASGVATVPLFNTWTIWWNADRLQHGFANYWHAPIFYPESGAFAFSEPQPGTLLVAPAFWLTGNLILTYKIYVILSLTLNGVFCLRLLRRLGVSGWAATCGGLFVILLPIVHQQNDVVQMMPLWAILWTWERLDVACRHPSLRTGALTGVAFGSSFLLSIHHGLFLTLLLPAGLLLLPGDCWKNRRLWLSISAAAVAFMIVAGPLLIPLHSVMQKYAFQRTDRMVTALSVRTSDYLALPKSALIGQHGDSRSINHRLHSGWIKTSLALAGIIVGLRRRQTRRMTAFLLLTGLLAMLLSHGNHLHLGTWKLWPSLVQLVPGMAQVRNVFRFAYFVQLIVAIFAAFALWRLYCYQHRSTSGLWSRRLATAGCLLLALASLIEVPPGRILLAGVPDVTKHQDWIEYVRSHTRAGRSVLCLPCSTGLKVRDFDVTTRWMYLATFHGQPLVNGYSGFFPDSYFAIQKALTGTSPNAEIGNLLSAANVDLIVVDTRQYDVRQITTGAAERYSLELLLQDAQGIHVYRLHRR